MATGWPTEPAVWVSHIHEHHQGAAGTAKLLVPTIPPAQEGRSRSSLFRQVLDGLVLLHGFLPTDAIKFLTDHIPGSALIQAVGAGRGGGCKSGTSRVWAESVKALNIPSLTGVLCFVPVECVCGLVPFRSLKREARTMKCLFCFFSQMLQVQSKMCTSAEAQTSLWYWEVSSSSFVVPWKMTLWNIRQCSRWSPRSSLATGVWGWLGLAAAVTVEGAAPWSAPALAAFAQGSLLGPPWLLLGSCPPACHVGRHEAKVADGPGGPRLLLLSFFFFLLLFFYFQSISIFTMDLFTEHILRFCF